MSTIPNPPAKTEPETARVLTPKKPHARDKASFRFGYRYQRKKLPNGRIDYEMVPLTLEDVLHPQFGDVHVLGDAHVHDCTYLLNVLEDRLAGDRSAKVLSDCGIYWDKPGLKHHSPDLAVIFGVKQRKKWETFHVKTEKVRPSLIVEVTSRSTRVNDVKTKVKEYAQAGVPHYVIADVHQVKKKRRITLIRYGLDGEAYQPVPLDEHGRAWLEPVGLWLGVTTDPETGDDRLVLIDPATNEEIGDYTAVRQARDAEAKLKRAATEQARAATEQAEVEARARIIAEAEVRELKAEIRRLRGQGTS
jgi:colicin import membrane protein